MCDEAAELYARSKWEEAIEDYDNALREDNRMGLKHKPEFKP